MYVCMCQVNGVHSSWDLDDWNTDTYYTGTPEMCTGVESHIRPGTILYACMYVCTFVCQYSSCLMYVGDPPEKCSFGHRPYNSAANNCYGMYVCMLMHLCMIILTDVCTQSSFYRKAVWHELRRSVIQMFRPWRYWSYMRM
jgi:hypothetical protein